MISRRQLLQTASAAGLLASGAAWAKYPERPIRLIVPLAAGGNGDIMARLVQTLMSASLSQSIVVDNKGGAGGGLGTDLAAHSPADGYTLLWGSNGSMVNSPLMLRKPRYDPLKDFQAVGLMSLVPMALVVSKNIPATNLKEFVAYAAKSGKGLNIGTSGIGGANHIPLELFKAATKANIEHVPYKGGGSALPDLMSGNVDGLLTEVSTVMDMHNEGRVRIVGLAADQRSPLLPNVETFMEFGLKDFTAYTFNGLWAPAGVPADVIQSLQVALATAVKDSNVIANVTKRAALIASAELQTPAGARAFLTKEIARAKQAMQIANIQPE